MANARNLKALPLKDRIAWARRTFGPSHDQFAAKLETSRFTVIKWEKGLHVPRPLYLERLGEVTGRPELFQPDDEEPSSMSLDDLLRYRIRELIREEMAAA